MALGPVPRVVVKVLPGARWRRGELGVFRGAGSPVFSFLSRRQHRLSLAPSFLGQTLCCLRGTIFQYPTDPSGNMALAAHKCSWRQANPLSAGKRRLAPGGSFSKSEKPKKPSSSAPTAGEAERRWQWQESVPRRLQPGCPVDRLHAGRQARLRPREGEGEGEGAPAAFARVRRLRLPSKEYPPLLSRVRSIHLPSKEAPPAE